jgi:ribosomal protein L10
MLRACVALLLCSSADALLPGALSAPRTAVTPRSGNVVMAGAKALAKKTEKLEDVRATMAEAQLMFCVRSEGLRVNDVNKLRQQLPEGVQLKCVKNTLINLAVKDFEQFNAENIDELLHYSNFWFFASEDKMRESFAIWKTFSKDKVRDACALVVHDIRPRSRADVTTAFAHQCRWLTSAPHGPFAAQENKVVGGVFAGKVMDAKGIEDVSSLPTKQELMQKTASLLAMLPAKLARALDQAGAVRIARGLEQARGQKMARAVKLASEKMP